MKREYARKNRRSWSRRENSLSHLKPFFGGMLVKGITTERVDRYVDKRMKEGAAPATINRELDTLRGMMRLGTRVTPPKVGTVPHFNFLTEQNVREGFLEHAEFLAIREAAPHHLKVPITIAYHTGWTAACKRAGVVGKTFHDLRRTAIRNMCAGDGGNEDQRPQDALGL